VKINSLFATRGKLIDGSLWIGQFAINAKRNSKSLILIPYDRNELVRYKLRIGIDYYAFVKVSMASIMRNRRRALLNLMAMILSKRISSSLINLNSKVIGTTRKLLWIGGVNISTLCESERLALLKLNKAIKFCRFALKANYKFSKTNDPLKLFRANRLISTIAYYFSISPEMLLFNLKLSCPKNFNKSTVNVMEIKRLYFQTLVTKSYLQLGDIKLQLLRHNWFLIFRRLKNMQNFNYNQFEIFILNLNFWTIFYRTLLRSSILPWASFKTFGLIEWRNNLMLNLSFINYALTFYKFSSERSPIISFALVILNKIKSLRFLLNPPAVQVEMKATLMPIISVALLTPPAVKTKMQLKPLFNRVIIVPDNVIKISTGGIMLPETMTDNISTGVISEVSDELSVKIGDKVLYNRNAALKYSLNGNIIDILDVAELLALIRND
ncbi:MAG: co-chaperone GroES family protein, partial [Candidatus Hodgkinia cicadicola]